MFTLAPRKYLAKMEPAVSGQGGHDRTFAAARALVHGFDLTQGESLAMLLDEYNPRCTPPWSEKELQHKVEEADTKPFDKPRGYLRDAEPRSQSVAVATPAAASPPSDLQSSTAVGPKPQFRSARELINTFPALRHPIIHGLLREGETMNIIAPPKVGKSWLVTDLALAVSTGRQWLGCEVERGDVLIIDNELHGETSADRIPKVAKALNISIDDYGDHLFVENLRGRLAPLDAMTSYFNNIKPGQFKLIVLDAWYRFQAPGSDENDNAAATAMYNLIDQHSRRLECAFVCIHHASKGNQSSKSVTDVGAGAGAQSRAADTHVVLRQHAKDCCYTIEAATRSWPPVVPVALQWEWPIWTPVLDLDPHLLAGVKPRNGGRDGNQADPWLPADVAEYVRSKGTIGRETLIEAVRVNASVNKEQATSLFRQAVEQGLILNSETSRNQPAKYVAACVENPPHTPQELPHTECGSSPCVEVLPTHGAESDKKESEPPKKRCQKKAKHETDTAMKQSKSPKKKREKKAKAKQSKRIVPTAAGCRPE